MKGDRTLTWDEALAFYDRFGSRQDSQRFYEDLAIGDLRAHAAFERAGSVFEFGCGTGRVAAELFGVLPPDATYVGCDLSTTMVRLARERLATFGSRAEVLQTDGSFPIHALDASFDRFLSTYVLDLLSASDIRSVLREAHRLLGREGLCCIACLTWGRTPLSRLVMGGWSRIHRLRPSLVGGCRPIELTDFVSPDRWEILHRNVLSAYGLPSEVLVVKKRE